MGQYYKFVNKTRKEESQISLPFNFGMAWAKSIERYDDKEVEAMFRFVTKNNEGWDEDDDTVAVGDYGTVIKYSDIKNRIDDKFKWEGYEPEKVPPKKLDDLNGIE
ncbi:MAG: hypothetical protein DRR08_24405 [Candidatus Parabeggiatoa sp. nov. 2]|nr:MAG: hypothetical protein B6247_25135 [Beggiatoa sp. 4572_84]RKZ55415.1 MAG: hypothetical protein DRR08_24405 [Gammaproteobacteria bacterium]